MEGARTYDLAMSEAPYRAQTRPLTDRHAVAWAKIRRAHNVAAASVFGILACGALMGLAAELRSVAAAVLLEVGVGAFIVLGLTNRDDARCPHCDAPFFGARPAVLVRRCPSCRTPMGARPHD